MSIALSTIKKCLLLKSNFNNGGKAVLIMVAALAAVFWLLPVGVEFENYGSPTSIVTRRHCG